MIITTIIHSKQYGLLSSSDARCRVVSRDLQDILQFDQAVAVAEIMFICVLSSVLLSGCLVSNTRMYLHVWWEKSIMASAVKILPG